jgi:hypothetical protein
VGTLRVATNCFFKALNWSTGKLPVVTGSYVSVSAGDAHLLGTPIHAMKALRSQKNFVREP